MEDILFDPIFDAALSTIIHKNFTPYLVVAVDGIDLPEAFNKYIIDGQVTLNISGAACSSLHKSNDCLYIDIGMQGQGHMVEIPNFNVKVLFAKENPMIQCIFIHPPVEKIPSHTELVHLDDSDLPENVTSIFKK